MNQNSGFKSLGEGTIIHEYAKIVKKDVIEIGSYCKIDDFVFIFGGEGVKIDDHTHIASNSVIGGGGSITIGKFVGISWGVKFATGTNEYRLQKHMTAAAPLETQGFIHGHIEIEDDVIIFANSVIMPNVKIGEGAVIGALTFVNKDIEPWSINVGCPCRKVGERPPLLEELRK